MLTQNYCAIYAHFVNLCYEIEHQQILREMRLDKRRLQDKWGPILLWTAIVKTSVCKRLGICSLHSSKSAIRGGIQDLDRARKQKMHFTRIISNLDIDD